MSAVAAFLVWTHLLAAVAWVGGMLFLSLILVPELKRHLPDGQRGILFKAVGRRFRLVVWGSITVLLATGPLLLLQRVPSLHDSSTWPTAAKVKLCLVGALLLATGLHDFWLGPKVARLRTGARSPAESLQVRMAPWIARGVLILALLVLLAAVLLART